MVECSVFLHEQDDMIDTFQRVCPYDCSKEAEAQQREGEHCEFCYNKDSVQLALNRPGEIALLLYNRSRSPVHPTFVARLHARCLAAALPTRQFIVTYQETANCKNPGVLDARAEWNHRFMPQVEDPIDQSQASDFMPKPPQAAFGLSGM